ncbi:polynucleotide phosphorylase/polyadenylase, partial [mine drainage metagenome]
MQSAIAAIHALVREAGKPRWSWQAPAHDAELAGAVDGKAREPLAQAYSITEKQQRYTRIGQIKTETLEALAGGEAPRWSGEQVEAALFKLESDIVRQRILKGEPRIDGRDCQTVRPITVKVGVLPRTHGSALFTR